MSKQAQRLRRKPLTAHEMRDQWQCKEGASNSNYEDACWCCGEERDEDDEESVGEQ